MRSIDIIPIEIDRYFKKDYQLSAYYMKPSCYKKSLIRFGGNERVSNQF